MQRLGGFLITKLKQLHSRSLAQCISEQGIDAFSGEQGKILFVLWQKDKITQNFLNFLLTFLSYQDILFVFSILYQ